jgi:hypothetical protein
MANQPTRESKSSAENRRKTAEVNFARGDEPEKYPRKSAAAKKREARKQPTPRQSRFAKALMKSKNLAQAAIAAGYSPKYAAQSAHQALQGIRLRVPEILDKAGYSVSVLIEKHLAPKLTATTTKLAAEKGEFTDHVELEDQDTQLKAIDMMLRMHGAYAPKDPKEAAHFGVKVVIIDVPRPQVGVWMPDVGPGDPLPPLPSKGFNGHKPQE